VQTGEGDLEYWWRLVETGGDWWRLVLGLGLIPVMAQVKEVIRSQFVFWQQYEGTPATEQYRGWYPYTEVPHIAIINGETGP